MTESEGSDLDNIKKTIGGFKKSSSLIMPKKFGGTPGKSSSGSQGTRLWEELEQLYREMEQREKDYAVAVEIGKMLLDKNKELQDQNSILEHQIELLSAQNGTHYTQLEAENKKLQEKKAELKRQVKHMKLEMDLLQSGKGDTEMKALLLSDEFTKMEEKLAEYKREINEYKQKNTRLSDELERYKGELEQSKEELAESRKLKRVASFKEDLTQEELLEREKLEEELAALALSKTKLESLMSELSVENVKLRENITEKEDQKSQMERMIESLSKANYMLQRQQEEERMLLEDKMNTISSLQARIEEQTLENHNNSFNLQMELLDFSQNEQNSSLIALNNSNMSNYHNNNNMMNISPMPSPRSLDQESSDDEELLQLKSWKERLSVLEQESKEFQKREEELIAASTILETDKEWLLDELKRFRKCKSEEHYFLSVVYDLRQKLFDAELRNLSRTMKHATSFHDVVLYSNNIIDSVILDVQKRILIRESINEIGTIRLVVDLILENCKLRKVANDYSEAINQGTVEKLERFKKFWPVKKSPSKKTGLWNGKLFDFFTGWKIEEPPASNQKKRLTTVPPGVGTSFIK